MALDCSASITTASANVSTDYVLIDVPGAGLDEGSPQVVRVFATCTGSPSAAGVARFVLVDTKGPSSGWTLVGGVEASLDIQTGTDNRTALDGASGQYVLGVSFPNGSDLLDLTGADAGGRYRWYAGCSAFPTGATAVTFNFAIASVI